MIGLGIVGIGVLGPGLSNWAQGAPVLDHAALRTHVPTVVPAPERLPATERRRAGAVVKAAIAVADQAVAASGLAPAGLATVFTSSTGDPSTCHQLCEALATPERLLSPTRFTNSVHNAPAGYWHIATSSRAASTSLAAFDASFGAGLLEAAVQCQATHAPVLLVACDVPYPQPLHGVRPLSDVFALALLLAPAGGRGLQIDLRADAAETVCDDAALDAVRSTIPAARALPLLQALARNAAARVNIEAAPGLMLQLDLAAR